MMVGNKQLFNLRELELSVFTFVVRLDAEQSHSKLDKSRIGLVSFTTLKVSIYQLILVQKVLF